MAFAFHVTGAEASDMSDTWRYESAVPDAIYGQPEYLDLAIRIEGTKVCGNFLSAYRGGMRVAEGSFSGSLSAGEAMVTYDAGWAGAAGEGKAKVRPIGATLSWHVLQPGPEPDHVIRTAVLRRASTTIEPPSTCR
jgi:hypothetical protein